MGLGCGLGHQDFENNPQIYSFTSNSNKWKFNHFHVGTVIIWKVIPNFHLYAGRNKGKISYCLIQFGGIFNVQVVTLIS